MNSCDIEPLLQAACDLAVRYRTGEPDLSLIHI